METNGNPAKTVDTCIQDPSADICKKSPSSDTDTTAPPDTISGTTPALIGSRSVEEYCWKPVGKKMALG